SMISSTPLAIVAGVGANPDICSMVIAIFPTPPIRSRLCKRGGHQRPRSWHWQAQRPPTGAHQEAFENAFAQAILHCQGSAMKAIIVGGGVMGLSTACGLLRECHDVELFEQGELPNSLASSMDEHRLIRHPYGDHIGYARMIDDAYAAWDLLWRDLGQRLYADTGTLALTGNGETWAERSAATLDGIGKTMEELPLRALA